MRTKWHRALLVSFFLIMSSLAGCIGTDDTDKDDELEEGQYGTVMVSTYHVGEIHVILRMHVILLVQVYIGL